ncbi:protein FAM135B-like isoform X2 [Salvia splendens]|uniref:protein FAM135B-like isoform X1 n=1 Tax=Salvia splendens TaxID=180675 RepID=UPI001C273F82|nr:protein FAM135B-like isoform X1 [Salvia splendens]XP_042003200.1 protein FAM135B-like isoform X1 [Salvia splendens]XP_042003201.1 protein FAM135B-like isoform X1 [Salvia splendens]XP_042003202.1 protein FAM135B-like isoform X2 [Salvia splendens]
MSVLLQHLKWMINGFNKSSSMGPRRLKGPDAKPLHQPKFVQPHKSPLNAINLKHDSETFKLPILGAIHEISIYIHRFHNLDLFQQGWYQLKITIRWENDDSGSFGTPARVVQYEAPDLGSDDIYGVWRIDDTDHSFSTQPFRIRYARQDILLAMMVSFNLSLSKLEDPSTSAVIVKFELLYAPVLENRYNVDACLDTSPAAVHEFRLPPKALLGLHAYCPVHFDAFHAVLVDTSVHASLLKSEVHTSSLKVPSDPISDKHDLAVEHNKIKQVILFKALSSAHDVLLEELQKLSKAIDVPIEMEEISSSIFFGTTQRSDQDLSDAEIPVHVSSKPLEVSQKHNGKADFLPDDFLYSLSEEKLVKSLDLIGNQVNYLWSTFLNFHRANAKKILEYLCNQWAVDRKAEWSIWMVYTKAEIPHQYISSVVDDTAIRGLRGRGSSVRNLACDPAQTAAMRAELHRRSIAQMRINNRSIQDLHVFGDPSRIPIVIVERVVNAPVRSTTGNFYFNQLDQKYTNGLVAGVDSIPPNKLSGPTHQTGRVLKIVVFVHGFQGHHLDLRLVRNQWLLIEPKAEVLMSEVNEDKTSGDFREMGQRLAQEVVSFVKKKMDKASRSGVLRTIKLSFVGHSIGNIIIRTALTETIMEPYLRFLHTYVSVSGPHLGYLYSSNSLFNGGLWLLKKLKGTQCIHQLTFTDDPDLQNTFLYKLCKEKTLEHFKNIILLSSPQDGYVPYHSARIEMCPASSGDYSKKGKLFLEMLNEYLDQIRAPSSEHRVLLRCDVNFDISLQRRNLNTLIGRAAHIKFLETDIFAKFIMWSFPELFR